MSYINLAGLSWKKSVLKCVRDWNRTDFLVSDIFEAYERALKIRFPENNFIRAGIRRELQNLRDDGHLAQGPENGQWLSLSKLVPDLGGFKVKEFSVSVGPKPNYPISELAETNTKFRNTQSRDREADKYLGSLGETVIIHHEKTLLENAGLKNLARKVEQVSETKGDAIGYDILSYHLDGTEKWIEVKTTKGAISTRFFISEKQVLVSELHPAKYWLYRLYEFDFDNHHASMYCLSGPLRSKLNLQPNKYSALPI